ncbi:MAG TPA: GPW/gp25 family protein [Bryobacteraceae bacterium]|nr:GPW/gp25 family protein [Bryobacteraceae bacterium]
MAIDEGQIYGRGVAFPPHLDSTGQWATSVAGQNVRESIQILLLTRFGERLMYPNYGSALRTYLFAPNNAATRKSVQDEITRALQIWEPRIVVDSILVDPDPSDGQAAIATIQYRLVANQLPNQVTLTLQLQG